MNLTGEWLRDGDEDRRCMIIQQGRVLMLMYFSTGEKDGNKGNWAGGLVNGRNIRVPSWDVIGTVEPNDQKIDWGAWGNWTRA